MLEHHALEVVVDSVADKEAALQQLCDLALHLREGQSAVLLADVPRLDPLFRTRTFQICMIK